MTDYATLETSEDAGRPVELFRFVHGPDVWTYTSGSVAIDHLSDTYYPLAMGRDGEMAITSEIGKNTLSVVLPIGCEVSQLYLVGSPECIVSVTVYRLHDEEDGAYEIYWKGRVVAASWKDGQAELSCESVFSSLKRQGLRAEYQRGCRHALYTSGCGVDKASFAVPCTVEDVDGSLMVITFASIQPLPAFAAGWFAAGMIMAGGAYRFVLASTATTVTISSPIVDLTAGDEVTLYPGCDHSRTVCSGKFSNILNYGGFPWIPTGNPFVGSVV